MALKADRHLARTDISFFCNQVLERGCIVVLDTAGSGSAMDQALAAVATPTGIAAGAVAPSSTYPVGLLLNDVVNIDQTRQHINWHHDEVQKGGKVTLLKNGFVVTNLITGSPTPGKSAYYDGNGYLTSTSNSSPVVGRFQSNKDADGYIKVDINITG